MKKLKIMQKKMGHHFYRLHNPIKKLKHRYEHIQEETGYLEYKIK